MKYIQYFSLPFARFLSKSLAILLFGIISPDNFIYVLYLFILFLIEGFLMLRFRMQWGVVLIILFSSIFSYLVPLYMKTFSIFIVFLASDIPSVLVYFNRAVFVAVLAPGFLFFFLNFPSVLFTMDVVSGKIKPYPDTDERIDFIKLDKLGDPTDLGKITFQDSEFIAKFAYGKDFFMFRAVPIDDTNIVVISILSAISVFFLGIYISRYISERKKVKAEFQKNFVISQERISDFGDIDSKSAYVDYLRESLIRVRENLKKEIDEIEKYERIFSKFGSSKTNIVDHSERYVSEINNFFREALNKIRIKRDYSNLPYKISEVISLLEDILLLSKRILFNISSFKDRIVYYDRTISQNFREFENFFHEIFSPLGGMENQVLSLKSSVGGKVSDHYDEIFKKCDEVILSLRDFLKNLGEIYESFHILHLNSQVRAHKIRDKVPSFEVVPHAIHMMLDKMKELMSNIQSELNSFEALVQELKKPYVEASSLNFNEVSLAISDLKSSLENIISSLSSIRSSFVSNIKSTVAVLIEFENSILALSNLFSSMLYEMRSIYNSVSYAVSQVYSEKEKISKYLTKVEEEST